MDPVGLRYYLPAYMIWTLKHGHRSDSNTPDYVIYTLLLNDYHHYEKLRDFNRGLGRQELWEYEQMRNWTLNRFAIFTPAQATVIADFLSFLAEQWKDTDARQALKNYWGQFLE